MNPVQNLCCVFSLTQIYTDTVIQPLLVADPNESTQVIQPGFTTPLQMLVEKGLDVVSMLTYHLSESTSETDGKSISFSQMET